MGKLKDQMMGEIPNMEDATPLLAMQDMKRVVVDHERSRPRSQQIQIGPSEAGNPCNRRLAYKLLGIEAINTDSDPWASIVGTGVHAWLDTAFHQENGRLGWDRWATSLKIDLPGYMRGTIDLYDHLTKTVIDHKVVGNTALKKAKDEGPSVQYTTQGQLYGAGLHIQGLEVQHVAIMYWSRSGMMRDAFLWSQPFDPNVTDVTLAKLDALKSITAAGADVLADIPTAADAFGMYCPYYLPAITNIAQGCPGHVGTNTPITTREKETLL